MCMDQVRSGDVKTPTSCAQFLLGRIFVIEFVWRDDFVVFTGDSYRFTGIIQVNIFGSFFEVCKGCKAST